MYNMSSLAALLVPSASFSALREPAFGLLCPDFVPSFVLLDIVFAPALCPSWFSLLVLSLTNYSIYVRETGDYIVPVVSYAALCVV